MATNDQSIRRRFYSMLKAAGIDKETAITMALLLRKHGKTEKMIVWLDAHPKAAEEEILQMSREIAHEK